MLAPSNVEGEDMISEQIIVSSPSTLEGQRHKMAEISLHNYDYENNFLTADLYLHVLYIIQCFKTYIC
jgi:hypothetical protein